MEVTCWRCGVVFDGETSAGRCPNCRYNVRSPFARLRSAVASYFAAFSKTPWHVLKLMAIGAVSFWTPDIIWHAMRGPNFGRFDVLAMTVLMPSTLTGIYILLRKRLATTPHLNVGLPLM